MQPWICPRCGVVWAWWVRSCTCSAYYPPPAVTTSTRNWRCAYDRSLTVPYPVPYPIQYPPCRVVMICNQEV